MDRIIYFLLKSYGREFRIIGIACSESDFNNLKKQIQNSITVENFTEYINGDMENFNAIRLDGFRRRKVKSFLLQFKSENKDFTKQLIHVVSQNRATYMMI